MTKQEVIDTIDIENWDGFIKWMAGQTCGIDKSGDIDYYDNDVAAYKRKLETGYDRQNNMEWD